MRPLTLIPRPRSALRKAFGKQADPDFTVKRFSDGNYHMKVPGKGWMKLGKDRARAEEFARKRRAGGGEKPQAKVGQTVRIRGSGRGSLGRGVVGKIKEIGQGFVRVADEAGRVFRVKTPALALAKAAPPPEPGPSGPLALYKARPGLVRQARLAARGGRTFRTHVWVRPGDRPAAAGGSRAAAVKEWLKSRSSLEVETLSPAEAASVLNSLGTDPDRLHAAREPANAAHAVGRIAASALVRRAAGQDLSAFRSRLEDLERATGDAVWNMDIREEATLYDPSSSEEDVAYAMMGAWGSSTNKVAAVMLQEAAAEELLGVTKFRVWQRHNMPAVRDEEARRLEAEVVRAQKAWQVTPANTPESAAAFDELDGRRAALHRHQDAARASGTRAYVPPEVFARARRAVRAMWGRTQEELRTRPPWSLEAQGRERAWRVACNTAAIRLQDVPGSADVLARMATAGSNAAATMRDYFGEVPADWSSPSAEAPRRVLAEAHSLMAGAVEEGRDPFDEETFRRCAAAVAEELTRKRPLLLYRGVTQDTVAGNVVESWSTSRSVARQFDGYDILEDAGVPYGRILAFWGSDSKLARNNLHHGEKEFLLLFDDPGEGGRP